MSGEKKISHHVSFKKIFMLAYPAILSMLSFNIMQFVDRYFVAQYNLTQFSAIMPSGIYAMTVTSIFMGIVGYVSALVSQYYGARKYKECSKSLWQSIYLAILFAVIFIITLPITSMVFDLLKHSENLLKYEKQYFSLSIFAACFHLFINAFSGFFSGTGDTKTPMLTSIVANLLNIFLDWIFVFGKFGFPEMGIFGAGLATVLSAFIGLLLLILFTFKKRILLKYRVYKHLNFDKEILFKMVKFGFPAGFQFFLAIGGMSIFMLLIGKMGEINLTSANIALTIESLSFMPIIGLSVAIGIISGQEKGAERVHNIPRAVKNGLIIAFVYNIIMIIIFNLFPEILISIFDNGKEPEKFVMIKKYTLPLVRIASVWLFFDSIQIIIGQVLKTMGDTVFLMIVTGILPIFFMAIPTYLIGIVFNLPIMWIWFLLALFVFVLAVSMSLRFAFGKWREINVI